MILQKKTTKNTMENSHMTTLLIIGGSGSGKTNTLLNLIKEQDDIDKIYLYAKDFDQKAQRCWYKRF